MVYAFDFVYNVIRQISSSEPVLFQRDGSLYIASDKGFGMITYNMRIAPEEIRPWENREQSPEIKESKDILRWIGEGYDKKPSINKNEVPYFKAISYGPDSEVFSLEEIIKSAKEMAKLEYDGKIRMVSHGSGYHSHKYGYACDGIDVWVQNARVMDKKRYLEIVKEKEDMIFNQMEQNVLMKEPRKMDTYDTFIIPYCIILTPNILVSLPRVGRFNDRHNTETGYYSWNKNTQLAVDDRESSHGTFLMHNSVNRYEKSPYKVDVTINSHKINASDVNDFKDKSSEFMKMIHTELSVVKTNMPLAEKYAERINEAHNKINANYIKEHSSKV